MLATDGSESAAAALEFAIDLCKRSRAELDIVSVRPTMPAPQIGWGHPEQPEVERREGAENIALAAAERAELAGVASRAHVETGDPADALTAAATRFEADLIVAGSRGHGPLTAAILGSVSTDLLERSPIPVTIVRPPASRPRP